MRGIRFVITFILTVLTMNSMALASKMCFCEIGNYPESQKLFFKAGCSLWFKSQNDCETQQIVSVGTSYKNLNLNSSIDELSIGYVGHWMDTHLTVRYLDQIIAPLMQNKNVSVSIDNTACNSMSRPDLVMNYVKSLKYPDGKTLKVRGNQTMSAGEWDGILGRAINFTAEVSSNSDSVQYPPCSKYDQQYCAQQFQKNQAGKCIDDSGQIKQLACCEAKVEQSHQDYQEQKVFIWTDLKNCQSLK